MEKEKLKEENRQLKMALCIYLNKPLVRKLAMALKRIEKGEYYTEEEFFRDSPLITA